MTTSETYFEHRNISAAWGMVLIRAMAERSGHVAPVVATITGFDGDGGCEEDIGVRKRLDALLSSKGKQSIETVAGTIFPSSLWNPAAGRRQLFERFAQIASRVRRSTRKNARGTYFERMVTGGPKGASNQLEHIIATFKKRRSVRRSTLQLGVFNPSLDHSTAAMLGFPCLQHVTFAPVGTRLNVNAFYATQYVVERAYGNYLGLSRLGHFVAHELGLTLAKLTCFTGIAMRDVNKSDLTPVVQAVETLLNK